MNRNKIMICKAALKLTKAGTPRQRKEGAGRPSLGKVKLTVHILPSTRAALGNKPGEAIDALIAKPATVPTPTSIPEQNAK